MTEPSTPRPRGRPKGSRDSYPRTRRYTKMPPAAPVEALMPAIKELIEAADLQGYNRAMGVRPRRSIEAVDRATLNLLGAMRRLIDESNTTIVESTNVL